MRLSFHGADRGVTGSCHLVSVGRHKILIDCGMFQGGHELDEENAAPFGFDPAAIDYLLLTHAHLDHCGRIPLLVQRGFRGEIITTAASRELARLVLLDSAHLHEEEARHRARKRQRNGGNGAEADVEGPLYDTLDALNSFDRFGRMVEYGERIELDGGIAATFHEAGHILGSASILLELPEDGRTKRILFSGDLGSNDRVLLNDPRPPGEVDAVVMEATYGDRDHRSLDASVREFIDAIRDAHERGGNVIIPTFALERAQELLYYLRLGMREKALPGTLRVYLDSPMAISATEIFRRHPEGYRPEIRALFAEGRDPFALPGLEFVREASESMALNQIRSGAVIMAGSGMCTGGRVRHHLRHNLAHADCSVIFVGFAAEGTLARIIIDGAKRVRLFGHDIPVRAKIHTINGFSAHADRSELLDWHARLGRPARTFLVHGEPRSMKALAKGLKHTQVVMPEQDQSYEL
ncbi:MBL fold metallo-hydrolase [Actibacterium sp. MT2.3-13A]|uniref:MBL fold metallo-hydrolase RNA specificity domain-containing protein n=1 Tax=Actibacterium sp. MT2.3-13A TaxID=2828332 RepID=UPI001BAD5304|nr:MBL fold metallo-hydrolase [Actibacterium sp. MT2.3-13A]